MPPARYEASLFFFLALARSSLLLRLSTLARRRFFPGDLLANSGDPTLLELSAARQPLACQVGATGPRGSTLRSSPPRSPPRLVRLRRIPRGVITRAPGEEVEPKPEPGERVVFGAHLDRGLGLPASAFFRRFLDFFGLQPHHLPANARVLLSCYVAFMEGYAGLWPDVDFWSRLFYLKSQMTEGRLRTCGAASIYPRAGSLFPKIPTVDSVKNWQMSFFYVKNANPAFDRINLPEYNPAPPTTRLNWGHNAKSACPDAEVNLLVGFLGGVRHRGPAERRGPPLHLHGAPGATTPGPRHKIGLMSGRLDPTRTSKVALTKAQVAHRVNNITKANMPEAWEWGLPPYDRAAPPERVSRLAPLTCGCVAHLLFICSCFPDFPRQEIEDGDLAHKIWTPDHVDPADQAATKPATMIRWCPTGRPRGAQPAAPRRSSGRRRRWSRPASTTGPIRAVPLRTRPPAASATSAPKKKRAAGGSTARLEGQAKRQRQQGPKKVPEMAGAAIKFTQGGASRRRVAPPPFRRQREPTPPPSTLARAPPVVVVPPVVTPPLAGILRLRSFAPGRRQASRPRAYSWRPVSHRAPPSPRGRSRPRCATGGRSWSRRLRRPRGRKWFPPGQPRRLRLRSRRDGADREGAAAEEPTRAKDADSRRW
ncbi:hypothetical protein QYE76_064449 [Lolium multiflorum]|uniref:Transposase (putative) gypsy type domain-containing protein n=1 Tax=Lolium multiflorum TaxID=4521 RepID=A0AAD8S7F6_LOLMU|nr:hypothetical protein QYE76_064449 [Lolium multiflorum]